jgi:phosphinothricin acetyltransferase
VRRIRLARPGDAGDIREIYAPAVSSSAVSFETEVPSVEEMRRRVEATLCRFPWLVVVDEGGIEGYAYAGPHRERAAYRWSVDVSVYVRAASRGQGVGTALYGVLLGLVRDLGCCNAYAGITLPNPGSVALHERMGFRPVAVYREVGFKLGRWHDVGWWHLGLRPRDTPPLPPRGLGEWLEQEGKESPLCAEGIEVAAGPGSADPAGARGAVGDEVRRLRGATDDALRAHDEELARKRRQWYRQEGRELHAGVSDPLERAYLVLLSKLGIEPWQAPIASRDARRLVFLSANPCPTLEACRILGLETARVCRLSSEGATDALVKEVDPRLRFRRNDDGLRPRARACEEMIEFSEEQG